jgi:hypothetical protein
MLLGEAAATHFGNSAGGSAQSLHHKQEEQYQKGLGIKTVLHHKCRKPPASNALNVDAFHATYRLHGKSVANTLKCCSRC